MSWLVGWLVGCFWLTDCLLVGWPSSLSSSSSLDCCRRWLSVVVGFLSSLSSLVVGFTVVVVVVVVDVVVGVVVGVVRRGSSAFRASDAALVAFESTWHHGHEFANLTWGLQRFLGMKWTRVVVHRLSMVCGRN